MTADAPTAAIPPAPEAERLTLLVADDHAENLRLFGLYLRRAYDVVEAVSAEEVLQRLDETPVAAALLDLNYQGGMSGFELIAALRAHPRHARLPTIALTAHASPEDRTRCLDAGFDAYLSKPVLRADMLAAVEALLAQTGHRAAA